jgi:hypothetical protein
LAGLLKFGGDLTDLTQRGADQVDLSSQRTVEGERAAHAEGFIIRMGQHCQNFIGRRCVNFCHRESVKFVQPRDYTLLPGR